MSKHWSPPRTRRHFTTGELRLALLASVLLGLIGAQLSETTAWSGGREEGAPEFAAVPAPDLYAEGRRSREILRPQENGPFGDLEQRRPKTVGRGDVVDVIDGDTFRYAGEKIRIADIDTPEVNGRCDSEKALAARATDRLAVLLAAGPFKLEPVERDEDRYGRKLRIVTRGGRSIGDQLVSEGLARTWTGRREPWCA
jgi:endonuclease YncB( thermonuclease family)